MEEQLKEYNSQIDVLTRKKVGVISIDFFEKIGDINNNYQMGLISFEELIGQFGSITQVYSILLKGQLNHKTEIIG